MRIASGGAWLEVGWGGPQRELGRLALDGDGDRDGPQLELKDDVGVWRLGPRLELDGGGREGLQLEMGLIGPEGPALTCGLIGGASKGGSERSEGVLF